MQAPALPDCRALAGRLGADHATPEGVIAGYPTDKQLWLKPGDVVTTTIEKLGELRFALA